MPPMSCKQSKTKMGRLNAETNGRQPVRLTSVA